MFDTSHHFPSLWFISQPETIMGKATLSVFFWVVVSVCVSATAPLLLFFLFHVPFLASFIPDLVPSKKKEKKGLVVM